MNSKVRCWHGNVDVPMCWIIKFCLWFILKLIEIKPNYTSFLSSSIIQHCLIKLWSLMCLKKGRSEVTLTFVHYITVNPLLTMHTNTSHMLFLYTDIVHIPFVSRWIVTCILSLTLLCTNWFSLGKQCRCRSTSFLWDLPDLHFLLLRLWQYD